MLSKDEQIEFALSLKQDIVNDSVLTTIESDLRTIRTDWADLKEWVTENFDRMYLRVPNTGNLWGASVACCANYRYLQDNLDLYPSMRFVGGYAHVQLAAVTTQEQADEIRRDFMELDGGYPVYSDEYLAREIEPRGEDWPDFLD